MMWTKRLLACVQYLDTTQLLVQVNK